MSKDKASSDGKTAELELDLGVDELAGIADPDRSLNPFIAKALRLHKDSIASYAILRRSVDARRKPDIRVLYKIKAALPGSGIGKDALRPDCDIYQDAPSPGAPPRNPVVVGAGPAGLFAAFLLARFGAAPIVVERGFNVERRKADIDKFLASRHLDESSNYLCGEGGAGTFSDGKLYTRTRDPRGAFVVESLAAFGAPPAIRYLQRPHVGSDILPHVVKRMRMAIESMGGRFVWGRRVKGIIRGPGGECQGVILDGGEELQAPATIMAFGHSERQLAAKLAAAGAEGSLKDFQLGCRIEHLQDFIDKAQLGPGDTQRKILGAAEYNLVSRPRGDSGVRGVTSFCMCPGGIVIPATNEAGLLSSNGMSRFKRDSGFANSALVANIDASQFHTLPEAFDFLRQIEADIFKSGGGDYAFPAQNASDFLNAADSARLHDSACELDAIPGRIDKLLPSPVAAAIAEALRHFDRLMPGFARSGLLIGAETRVSSPFRFHRHPETSQSSIGNLYFAGEGAGQAGGIVSAAVDGLKAAEKILGLDPPKTPAATPSPCPRETML